MAGEKGYASSGCRFDFVELPPHPDLVVVDLADDDLAAGVSMFNVCALRNHAAHDLTCCPRHSGDRWNPQALVHLRAAGVINARNDVFHSVRFAGCSRRDDVGVVAAADGGEGVSSSNSCRFQGLPIKSDAANGLTLKCRTQPTKRLFILVDDGHGVTGFVESIGEQGPHASCAKNHNVHVVTLHRNSSEHDFGDRHGGAGGAGNRRVAGSQP